MSGRLCDGRRAEANDRREINEDDAPLDGELMLRFIELQSDGRAGQRLRGR
jgi:hypothetical protein